jgi:SWI/SNF-related matrix-associated actin-dependent regulator of chromatin subfamily A member 5
MNYATPRKIIKKKRISNGRNPVKPIKLRSDLNATVSDRKPKQRADTARNQIRDEIAEQTKPRRDQFLRANKNAFLPLLPLNNYVEKLARRMEAAAVSTVPYKQIEIEPDGVKATMKPYQLEGLSFLVCNLTSQILLEPSADLFRTGVHAQKRHVKHSWR